LFHASVIQKYFMKYILFEERKKLDEDELEELRLKEEEEKKQKEAEKVRIIIFWNCLPL